MSIIERLTDWWRARQAPERAPAPASVPAGPVIAGTALDDSPVVRTVAEQLRQHELAAGGWAAEAGALPAEAYLPEARRLVRAIALGDAQAGPPTP